MHDKYMGIPGNTWVAINATLKLMLQLQQPFQAITLRSVIVLHMGMLHTGHKKNTIIYKFYYLTVTRTKHNFRPTIARLWAFPIPL